MDNARPFRIVVIVALPVCVGLFYLTAVNHFGYTPDDTYIYLQYARNILNGEGISFNAGIPSYGFTSPLWLGFITVVGKGGGDLLVVAKSLDLILAAIALLLLYLLGYELYRDHAVALLAMIAVSLNIWLLRWAGTGMDASLTLALVFATVLFTLRNNYMYAAVAAAFAQLARPEAILLFPLIVADLFVNDRSPRHAFRHAALMLVLYAALVLPWPIAAYKNFGTALPNTALAKGGFHFTIDEVASTADDVALTIGFSDGMAIVLFAGSAIALMIWWRRNKGEEEAVTGGFYILRQSLVGIGWMILLPLFYIVTGVNVISRYLLLVTPFIVLYGIWYLSIAISRSRWRRYTYAVLFVGVALMMLQNQFVYRRYVFPGISAFQQGMETCLIPIGEWLKKNTASESVIFAPDVGAIGYFSGRKICDAAALITPAMLPAVREGISQEKMIEEGMFSSVCGAQYIVDRSFVRERWKDRPDLMPLITRPFVQMGLGDTRINYYTVYKVIEATGN